MAPITTHFQLLSTVSNQLSLTFTNVDHLMILKWLEEYFKCVCLIMKVELI